MSRQGPPVGLIITVVAVSAAGLLLWMILRSGEDGASARSTPPGTTPERVVSRESPPRVEDSSRPGVPQVLPSEPSGSARSGDKTPPTESIINGVRVRDHRKDRTKPIALSSVERPAHARKIPPELTKSISDRILPIVRECGAAVPPEARGTKPRIEGPVVIAIKDHQVKVTGATLELMDVTGDAVEQVTQCIQQKTLGITTSAADEADLENYPIQINFTLPR
jgi:hypothetical protein